MNKYIVNITYFKETRMLVIGWVLWSPNRSKPLMKRYLFSDNSDLIACTVVYKDGTKMRRFLVIDILQLILVEPDTKRLGWGVSKLVGFLQDIEVAGDKDDSRCLHITIHRPISGASTNRVPLLNAKFVFDDNIRCMAAKQRLTKVRKLFLFFKLFFFSINVTLMILIYLKLKISECTIYKYQGFC